jgi:hypothetical protein
MSQSGAGGTSLLDVIPDVVRGRKSQIPPDLVVKSQVVDIIGFIFADHQGQNVIETSLRHMKIGFELLSPSKGNWFTT